MHEYDRYFANLFLEGPLARLVETLFYDRVVGNSLQYFDKPPGVG